jgi:hypothetical protein
MSKAANLACIVGIVFLLFCIYGITKIDEPKTAKVESTEYTTPTIAAASSEPSESEPNVAAETSKGEYATFSSDSDRTIEYMTVVQQIANNFYNIKYPWSSDEWIFQDYDDADDSRVIGMVDVTVPDQADKQQLTCIFEYDGSQFSALYLALGSDLKVCDSSVVDLVKGLGMPYSE